MGFAAGVPVNFLFKNHQLKKAPKKSEEPTTAN
jgi:hypothetical protein